MDWTAVVAIVALAFAAGALYALYRVATNAFEALLKAKAECKRDELVANLAQDLRSIAVALAKGPKAQDDPNPNQPGRSTSCAGAKPGKV